MKKIKTFYSNLRIKYKMFLLISIILIAFSVGGISILQYAFNTYNNEIYRQSAQSLDVASISIENELKKMERLSYQVATDLLVQDHLLNLKRNENVYNRFLIGSKLNERLLQIGALNKYVNSIQVYDWNDNEYKVGNNIITIPQKRLEEIKDNAQAQEGGAEWVFPDNIDSSLIVTRDVRYHITLTLEKIGIIVIRFNIEDIVSDMIGNVDKDDINFIIFNEDNSLVYSMGNTLPNNYELARMKDEKGYSLLEINHEKYFATYKPSHHTNWKYVIISPYGSLFQAISTVKKAVITIYTILFLFIMFIGMRFSNNITRPIESLNKKMKRVETGELNPLREENFEIFSTDELGEMHHNFQIMMDQINTLIKENYQKQIAIKDSEYKALQAQINPHFLYNTLDSINWAAKISGQKKISEISESLGFLMRTSIAAKEALIPIREEIKTVNSYVTIQSYRFEERLDFQMNIPEEIMVKKVPKFILQPLIENSIIHGLQQMIGVCQIKVLGRVKGDKIVITVEDNGPGMDKQFLNLLRTETYKSKGTGLGLKNIRERIKLLFGEPYGIKIESEKHQGTTVHIYIPYKEG